MNQDVIVCPKCDRILEPGEDFCPVDHGIVGGVHGIPRSMVEATPRAKRHLLGISVNGSYTINGFLGAGGFGAVYRAEQVALGRDVALKLLMLDLARDETTIGRFKREARTSAALLDPNIVPIFDYGEANFGESEEDHVLFFAMELVNGPTLRRVIKDAKGLSVNDSLQYGINILRGLSAAHHQGVVHRDLKPGNVLIDESKNRKYFARLFDFGISSLQGSGGKTMHLGQGGVLGTPKYMAPEQWHCQPTTPCTDVYAFGVMMAEMLIGHAPIPKGEMAEMAAAHCRAPRPQVTKTSHGEDVPEPLTRFIQKCMAIDPRQRYASAKDALVALEAIDQQRERAPLPTISLVDVPNYAVDDVSQSGQNSYSYAAGQGAVRGRSLPEEILLSQTDISRPISQRFSPLPETVLPAEALTLHHTRQQLGDISEQLNSEVLSVQLEEPRRIWPWVLAFVGLLLIAVLIIVGRWVVKAIDDARQVTMNAPVVSPMNPVVNPINPGEAGQLLPTSPMNPVVVPNPALNPSVVVMGNPPEAPKPVEPETTKPEAPKPVEPEVAKTENDNKHTTASKPREPKPREPKPVKPQPPSEPQKPAVARSNAGETKYNLAVDAERRGAPDSALKLFQAALKLGLSEEKAAYANRRIAEIKKRQASVEDDEF